MSARIIYTEHVYPPIPIRNMDWMAVFDGYDAGDPMGRGPTEEDAIADLLNETGYEGQIEIKRW